MIIAGLEFNKETMLRLTSSQFAELRSERETIVDYPSVKDYRIDERFARIFLAFDGSLSNFYFEFEPGNDIDTFIHNSYLTHFFPKTGKVKLIDHLADPLVKLLPAKPLDTATIPAIGKAGFSEQLDAHHVFVNKLDEQAVSNLLRKGSYKGQISCCECGIAGCSSEYLWAEDFYGLMSFHIVAASLQVVMLYPFQIV